MDAQQWNDRYAEKDLVWSATPNMFVEQILADVAPGLAIDLAAGEARNAIWLAQQGWEVTAVDFSDVAIEKANQLAAHADVSITGLVADLTGWIPTIDTYDLVLINYLQLPADQLAPIIENAGQAVSIGGMFLLVNHDVSNLTDGVGGPPNAAVLTTPDQVVDALGDGFDIERAEVAKRPVEGADRDALDTLVVAKRVGGLA